MFKSILPIAFFCLLASGLFGQSVYLLKDINNDPGGGESRGYLAGPGGLTYFVGLGPGNVPGFFKTNGTPAGTSLVKSQGGAAGSSTNNFGSSFPVFANGKVLFWQFSAGFGGGELWASDGSTAGTVKIFELLGTEFDEFLVENIQKTSTAAYFANDFDLYKTDGTAAGTSKISYQPGGFSDLLAFNDSLYFQSQVAGTAHLFRADKNFQGLTDLGSPGAGAWNLRHDGSRLFWESIYFNNPVIIRSPGMAAVTGFESAQIESPKDNPGFHSVSIGNAYYFIGKKSTTSIGLWKVTATAVTELKNWAAPTYYQTPEHYELQRAGNRLVVLLNRATFDNAVMEIWTSDGTAAGTVLSQNLLGFGNQGLGGSFSASNGTTAIMLVPSLSGSFAPEIWKSDGTTPGTVKVGDVPVAIQAFQSPREFEIVGGFAYFSIGSGSAFGFSGDPFAVDISGSLPPTPCTILPKLTARWCSDNATPNNPTDDSYTSAFRVEGQSLGTMGWQTSAGVMPAYSGNYFAFSTFPNQAAGAYNLTFRDVEKTTCTAVYPSFTLPTGGCSSPNPTRDLLPADLKLGSPSVAIGGSVAVTVDLFYNGTGNAGTIPAELYLSTDANFTLSDTKLTTDYFTYLPNHYYNDVSLVGQISASQPAGNYWIFVVLDGFVNNLVIETNENNNVIGLPLIVGNPSPCSPDVIAPVLSGCPVSQNLTTAGTSAIANWTAPTATDACPGAVSLSPSHPNGSNFPLGQTTVIYTATDAAGNISTCSFNITVTQTGNPCAPDVLPPTLSCPGNQSLVATGTSIIATWSAPTPIDNCTPANQVVLTTTNAPNTAFPLGNTIVTYTARDLANNQSTCSFTISVTNAPTGGCTNNLLQNGGFENNLTNWEGNGGVISTTASAGTKSVKLCLNHDLRQTIATAAGKNLTLLFKARTETTGANKVLSYIKYLNSSFTPLATEFLDFNTTATFSQATVSKLSPTGAAFVEIGFLKQTAGCVLLDEVCLSESGGGNPCSPDVTAPVISNCPAPQNLTTTGTSATANWTAPTATDACPGAVMLTSNFASGAAFPLGTTTVIFTAKDAANNTSSCFFSINVTQTGNPCSPDVLPPTLFCPGNQSLVTTGTSIIATWSAPTPVDNCTAANQIILTTTNAPNTPFPIGNTIVTYTARDLANNQSTCSFTVSVSSAPTGGCANNLLQNGGFENSLTNWEGNGGTISTTASAGTKSVKLCQNHDLRQTLATTPGKNLTLLFKARTETTGANKVLSYIKYLNSSFTPLATEFFDFNTTAVFASATVSKLSPTGAAWVEIGFLKQTTGCVLVDEVCLSEGGGGNPCSPDATPPVISGCPASQNLTTAGTSATATWTAPTATDACPGAVTWTNSHSPGTGFPLGTTTVIYTAKDAANNTAVCSFTITVSQQTGNCGTGCGFDKTFGAFPNLLNVFQSDAANIPNCSFRVSTFGNGTPGNQDFNYRELSLDPNGAQTASLNQTFSVLTTSGAPSRTADGNFVFVEDFAAGAIPLKKITPTGGAVWTKLVAFTPSKSPLGNYLIGKPGVLPDGYLVVGAYQYFPIPGQAPRLIPFLVKTDLNGNKLWQTELPEFNDSFGVYSFDNIAPSGNIYLQFYNSNQINLVKITPAGAQVWNVPVLGDLPSSDLISVHESSDGSGVFVTRYDNQFSYTRKLASTTGTELWQKAYSTIPIYTDFTFSRARGSISTTDGGLVTGFRYNSPANPSILGTAYAKIDGSGNLVWFKTLGSEYDLGARLATADGGYLLSGQKDADWSVVKVTGAGELAPICGGGTGQPDLTLQNLTTTQTSVAVGSALNFKFDLKNIGTATASGNFTIKSYLSTDNVLSANDIQNGSIPTGNLAAGQTVAQVSGALTVPAGTAVGSYVLILKVDADNQITESSENNNVLLHSSLIVVTTGGGGPGADLKLTITADKTTVPQWGNVTFTITAKNEGTTAISSAVVKVGGCAAGVFSNFDGNFKLVFAGTPPPATVGNFNFVAQEWTISNLAAGAQGVLTLPLFTTSTAEKKVVAWSKTQSPTDPDSQPSASIFANCTAVQDDEAVFTINLGQSGQAVSPLSNGNPAAVLADFSIFPNPTDGHATLNLGQFLGKNISISATDAFGKTVFFEKIEEVGGPYFDLDFSENSNGVYFVKIETEGWRPMIKRLIINKL